MFNPVPSTTFQFSLREVTFGDDVIRAERLPDDQWSYQLGTATRTPRTNYAAKMQIEVWLGVEDIEVQDPNNPESFIPLAIDRDDNGYYREDEFLKWLRKRNSKDVTAIHNAVMEKNAEWKVMP